MSEGRGAGRAAAASITCPIVHHRWRLLSRAIILVRPDKGWGGGGWTAWRDVHPVHAASVIRTPSPPPTPAPGAQNPKHRAHTVLSSQIASLSQAEEKTAIGTFAIGYYPGAPACGIPISSRCTTTTGRSIRHCARKPSPSVQQQDWIRMAQFDDCGRNGQFPQSAQRPPAQPTVTVTVPTR